MTSKVLLIILDGWGIGKKESGNAIESAHTPFYDHCLLQYPHAQLLTHGEYVGLPEGQMGNSEVGHLNIGAGRIVYQELVRINKSIESGEFYSRPALVNAFSYARQQQKNVHLIGLVSDGGVHSHIHHLKALCDMAEKQQVPVFIHAFTDGRDCDPHSARKHLRTLLSYIEYKPAQLVSVIGRYYAMDRDKRWERIKLAYDLLIHGKGKPTKDFLSSLEESYTQGITDEFLLPHVLTDAQQKPIGRIAEGDVVICFNFRTDRCRQITIALTQQDFPEYEMKTLPLHYVTMTRYDDEFKNIHVVFDKENLHNTLGEVIARHGLTQLRIAETEKYPHVTYFFSGGREEPFEKENRILIPSPKVKTYDLQPEMSAREVAQATIHEIGAHTPDFICLNFANPDMVGHTGNFNAIVKAIETVDAATENVVKKALAKNYIIIIIADHGNAEYTRNEDGSINTAHTTNPVPFIVINYPEITLKNGKLADIAPTILTLMNLPIPAVMTGEILITKTKIQN